ncbi:MAG: hypothetical protein WCO06_02480 [Candidatus Roizmanbacteria bacterium]
MNHIKKNLIIYIPLFYAFTFILVMTLSFIFDRNGCIEPKDNFGPFAPPCYLLSNIVGYLLVPFSLLQNIDFTYSFVTFSLLFNSLFLYLVLKTIVEYKSRKKSK